MKLIAMFWVIFFFLPPFHMQCKCARNNQRENESCIRDNLHGVRFWLHFAPADSLIRFGTRIGAIKFLQFPN